MTKFLPEDATNRKWEFYGASAMPIYITIYSRLYTKGFLERYGTSSDAAIVWKGEQIKWFADGAQFTQLAERVLPLLCEQGWNYYDKWEKEADVFERYHYDFFKTDISGFSDEDLRASVQHYRAAFTQQFITNNVVEFLSYYFQHHLLDLLVKEGVSASEATHLMHTYGVVARDGYLKRAAKEYAAATTPEEIARILTKYHYIKSDYRGPQPVTEVDLKALGDPVSNEEFVSVPKDLPEGLRKLLVVMQLSATMQDTRKAQLLMMVCAARKFVDEFVCRTGLPLELLERSTWSEMEEGWFDAKILRARQDHCFMYWDKDGEVTYTGIEASEIAHVFETHVLATGENTKELKGVCASRGHVSGRVVVVTNPNEFGKVGDGDVLVTMMTRPEYLPVMYKAAAFLCDEGGITSHAAIVAREMRKPCVIALKVATKILHDGDLVEIDADNGIVKILQAM